MGITFSFLIFVCVIATYFLNRRLPGGLVLEPGILFVTILFAVTLNSTIAYLIYGTSLNNEPPWKLWNDDILEYVLFLHIILIVPFTITYLFLISRFERNKQPLSSLYSAKIQSFYTINVWIPITLVVVLGSYTLNILSLNYLHVYYSVVVDLSVSALYATILIRFKTKRVMIFSSIIFSCFLMFVYVPLMNEAPYTVNKSGVIKLLVFGLVLVELVKYRGQSIKLPALYTGIFFVMLLSGSANYIEALINGSNVDFHDLVKYVLSGIEWRMLENTAVVIDAVEKSKVSFIYGESFFSAFNELFFPYQDNLQLSEWIVQLIPGDPTRTARYAFSIIAEGYINFGNTGVALAGIITAFLLYMIRYSLLVNSRFSPLFYSASIVLPYYLFRTHLLYGFKKVELTIIAILILISIYYFLRAASKNLNQEASNEKRG